MEVRYETLVDQMPDLCVPACIEMILIRRGLPSPGQLELAKMLSFVPSVELAHLYPGFTPTTDAGQRGCHVTNLNKQLFEPLGLPLEEVYLTPSWYSYDWMKFVKNMKRTLEDGDDVILSLDHAVVVGVQGECWRHAVVLEWVSKKESGLITPNPSKPTYRERADNGRLMRAMSISGGGVWCIREKG